MGKCEVKSDCRGVNCGITQDYRAMLNGGHMLNEQGVIKRKGDLLFLQKNYLVNFEIVQVLHGCESLRTTLFAGVWGT